MTDMVSDTVFEDSGFDRVLVTKLLVIYVNVYDLMLLSKGLIEME